MLLNVHPALSPELIYVLAQMGHGDEIAIVDANFPAVSHAQRLVPVPGLSATKTLEAILTVFPLDTFVEHPLTTMQVVDQPGQVPEIVTAFHDIAARSFPELVPDAIPREAFYSRTRQAFAIVATSETRLYGNVLIVKGVVHPADGGAG